MNQNHKKKSDTTHWYDGAFYRAFIDPIAGGLDSFLKEQNLTISEEKLYKMGVGKIVKARR